MSTQNRYVNWYEEELDKFYEHDNDGLVHGIYLFDEDDDSFPYHVEWFKTEEEAFKALESV